MRLDEPGRTRCSPRAGDWKTEVDVYEPGRIIDGKYELARELGRGAMGTVFEAVHVVTRSRVALKLLNAEATREARSEERFLREVRLASELRHENVVQVYDAGRDREDGRLYIAMELLHGEDLEARLFAGTATRAQGLAWVRQALPALAYAHALGIVHRDLKPENLFLASDDEGRERIKLLDFGVARELNGASVTRTGTAVGTPLYMSPEQALRPQTADHRADLWAIGIVLYEILAGRTPFEDESPHAVVLRASSEPHEPLPSWVDPRLVTLIDRCLAKKPDQRVGDAQEIAAVLDEVLADPSARAVLEAPIESVPSPAVPPERMLAPTLDAAMLPSRPASSSASALVAPPPPAKSSRSWRFVAVGLGAVVASFALVVALRTPREDPPRPAVEPVARPAIAPATRPTTSPTDTPAPRVEPATAIVPAPSPVVAPRRARTSRDRNRAPDPVNASPEVPAESIEQAPVAAELPVAPPPEPPSIDDDPPTAPPVVAAPAIEPRPATGLDAPPPRLPPPPRPTPPTERTPARRPSTPSPAPPSLF